MSGLLLPKHWRINWPSLMAGHLTRSPGGHLQRTTTGHLSKCPTCSCTVPSPTQPACKCLDGDYGSFLNAGDATVTIAGSVTPFEVTCSPGGPMTGSTAASIAGTYVLPCTTASLCYFQTEDVGCPTGGWWYGAGVKFDYHYAQFAHYVQVQLLAYKLSGGPFYSTPTNPGHCGPWFPAQTWTRTITFALDEQFAHWAYVPSSTCRAECNSVRMIRACISGSQTATSDVKVGASPNPCDGYSVPTLSIAAAS